MMKKIIGVMFLCLSILIALPYQTGQARIADAQVALGGITYRSDINRVIRIYGRPSKIMSSGSIYCWGTSFEVFNDSGKVMGITTTANNGIETPAGIHVGMAESVITQTYGRAEDTGTDSSGRKYYGYSSSNNGCFIFRTKNGKIVEIDIVAGLY